MMSMGRKTANKYFMDHGTFGSVQFKLTRLWDTRPVIFADLQNVISPCVISGYYGLKLHAHKEILICI